MSDGFGFLRFDNYQPSQNDVYVSPTQMKFALEEYVKSVIAASDMQSSEYHTRKITYVPSQTPERRRDGADSVTEKDRQSFAEVFRDDDTVEEKKDYKKWYILIGALAVILVVMVAVLIKGFSGDDSGKVDNTVQNNTYVSDTITSEESTTQTVTEESTEGIDAAKAVDTEGIIGAVSIWCYCPFISFI